MFLYLEFSSENKLSISIHFFGKNRKVRQMRFLWVAEAGLTSSSRDLSCTMSLFLEIKLVFVNSDKKIGPIREFGFVFS